MYDYMPNSIGDIAISSKTLASPNKTTRLYLLICYMYRFDNKLERHRP